jgi:HAE1 family hydrophobic/amphiphilic exporter-1
MFIVFQAIQEKVRPIQFDATVADWQIKEEVEKADEERKQYLENKKK